MISMCPSLDTDGSMFDLKSDCDVLYNCIGFAMGLNNVCVALGHPLGLDWCWWPPTAHYDENLNSLVEAFEYFGFSVCDNGHIEEGFDKVALYEKDGKWQHAAIIEDENLYHSKMGVWWDIVHRGGDLFHDEAYGDIYKYMKRPIADRKITQEKRPDVGIMRTPHHLFAVMQKDGVRYGYVMIA